MNVFIDKGEKKEAFRNLIPKRFLFQPVILLGCEDEGNLTGAAIVEKTGMDMRLLWIWVKEGFRRKGAGTALLDEAVRLARKAEAECLRVVYAASEKSSPVLDYMLAKRWFDLTLENIASVRVTREELLASPLLAMRLPDAKPGVRVVPLQKAAPQQLQKLTRFYEARQEYMISRADYMNADRRQSMILMVGEKPGGMTLLQHRPEDGHFLLDLFFLEKYAGQDGIRLLKETAEALIPPVVHFKSLEFACVQKQAFSLAEKLLGDKSIYYESVTEGVLWL